MRAPAIGVLLALGFVGTADSSTDYIFANSFEIECDGGGCTYCSPADPVPVCGAKSHCLPHVNSTSVCTCPAGAGASGASCATDADCAGPYACIDSGSNSTCEQWCQVPNGICPVAQTCASLAVPLFTGSTEWGVCR